VIDTESKLLLEIDVLSRRGTDPAAAFLHRLQEKHELDDTEFLVDAGGYLTAPHLTKIERPAQASRPEPRRKMVPDYPPVDRPLSLLPAGQSSQCSPLAATVQTPPQPQSAESGPRWTNSS
jgi:hypothetical protein